VEFGGHNRLEKAENYRFLRHNEPFCNRRYHLKLYIPNRCAIVLIAEQNYKKEHENTGLFSETNKHAIEEVFFEIKENKDSK